MDLLSQYKQEHPEAFQEKKFLQRNDEYGRTYTGMVALVMRLSGGRVRDINTASKILFFVVIIMFVVAVSWWLWGSGRSIDTKKNFIPAVPQATR